MSAESLYRCSECESGEHLTAYARSVTYGSLGADGELAEHRETDTCFTFVDSIECDIHMSDGVIEKWVDGSYVRSVTCSECKGKGKTYSSFICRPCNGEGFRWGPTDSEPETQAPEVPPKNFSSGSSGGAVLAEETKQ